MKCDKKYMLLYAVTDRTWVGEKTLYQQVEEALRGGVTCVQLREKDMGDEDFLQEAKEIHALCQQYGVPFIVNDNVAVAVACGAEGIHVGQEDMAAGDVRRQVGSSMILGVSVHTVEEARQAVRDGADYLGLGAVFPTGTKTDADGCRSNAQRNPAGYLRCRRCTHRGYWRYQPQQHRKAGRERRGWRGAGICYLFCA